MSRQSTLILIGSAVLLAGWACFSAGPASRPAVPAGGLASGPASAPGATTPASTQASTQAATRADDVPAVWKEMFPQGLIDADGNAADLGRLKGKIVGVYFSASWCLPCRALTPLLVEFRDRNAGDFEVVFVSSDRTRQEHRKGMADARMKWLAVEWRSPPAAAVRKKLDPRIIPSLVILAPDGKEITRDGRDDVEGDPNVALAKWRKQAGLNAASPAPASQPAASRPATSRPATSEPAASQPTGSRPAN